MSEAKRSEACLCRQTATSTTKLNNNFYYSTQFTSHLVRSAQGDVDDIHEYLLLKGVAAVSIHGGKAQDERNESITRFKMESGGQAADVLVATDIAAKGLDFPDIQHVINFDMPNEIENYVHRIGRTGRCGKTGVATTFINKNCEGERAMIDKTPTSTPTSTLN